MKNWFEVDKEGLARVLSRRSKAFVLYELLQNSWDSGARNVTVRIGPVQNKPQTEITIGDDSPDGFKNLDHAYTLYAESEKKSDPEKRGCFNLGEKMVLALCDWAQVTSTTGQVTFDKDGRHRSRVKRERGTILRCIVRMTRDEMNEMLAAVRYVIPPPTIMTVVNERELWTRSPIARFDTTLPTTVADEEGFLRERRRKTEVRVYERFSSSPVRLYELGIPVVEIESPWEIEICQRVPLNQDRDNVRPSFLREVMVAVVNRMRSMIGSEEATNSGVLDALGDSRIDVESVRIIVAAREGEGAVVRNPNDREANFAAFAHRVTVVEPRRYSAAQWEQIRKAEALPPAGQIYPTKIEPGVPALPRERWTAGMARVAKYIEDVSGTVIGRMVQTRFEDNPSSSILAHYGDAMMTINVGRLGWDIGNDGITVELNKTIIHEFAHEFGEEHGSAAFYNGCCRVGARLVMLALSQPELFR